MTVFKLFASFFGKIFGGVVRINNLSMMPACHPGEYFFYEKFSLGGEIQVNLDFTNIKADYHDLEESSNSIGTNTEIYIRFYLK